MHKIYRWTTPLIGLIFLVAIFLRIGVPDVDRQIVAGDEETYHFSALNLIHHNTFTRDVTGEMLSGKKELTPTAGLSPGFPVFIAGIYSLFGEDPRNVLVANVALSILSFWLIYRLLRILNASSVGLVVALSVAAVYPGFLYNNDRLLTEQLFMALFLSAVYLFLKGTDTRKSSILATSGVILAAAVHVRAQAVPFALLGVLYLAVYTGRNRDFAKLALSFAVGFFLGMAPWWLRNYLLLNEFIPLTHATNGPKVWGAVPYYLDMATTNSRDLSEITASSWSASPASYMRWRLFGYMNYMWADVWDERLIHPGMFLQRVAFICQMLLVVPAMIAMPWLIKKRIPQWTLIATIPLAIVLPNVIFHGLPRYAVLAMPYVIIVLGLLLTRQKLFKADGLSLWQLRAHHFGHITVLCVSAVYAVWIAYSVYVFPSRMPTDMSSYRLGKYAHTSIADLKDTDIVFDATYKPSQFEIWNSQAVDGSNRFQNSADPGIFNLKLGYREGSSITRVAINMEDGAPYDYTTLYWGTLAKPGMSESRFYKAPRFWFKERQVFYIDADATELILLPSVLQGNAFTLHSVRVTKYRLPK